MANKRSYRLLCPIARALDRVGDRWTLLILRDLHAGPARFSDLQKGLTGLASNLLTTRLRQLQIDGLIHRGPGTQLYELTPRGEATAPLLFELASYGSQFSPPEEVRRPGNLRTIAVTLKESFRRVVDADTHVRVELCVDGESFAIGIVGGKVRVAYEADPDAPVSISTTYDGMVATADGEMALGEFLSGHLQIQRGTMHEVQGFLELMGRAFGRG